MVVPDIGDWDCAVDQAHAGQRANKHAGISALDGVKDRTRVKAQDVALVVSIEDVGRIKIIRIERRAPARAQTDISAKIQPAESRMPGGWNRHRHVAIACAQIESWSCDCR